MRDREWRRLPRLAPCHAIIVKVSSDSRFKGWKFVRYAYTGTHEALVWVQLPILGPKALFGLGKLRLSKFGDGDLSEMCGRALSLE